MNPSGSEPDGPIAIIEDIRDARTADAASIEAVHFASREAAYSEHVSSWPPAGPGRAERVERWGRWLSNPGIHCLVLEQDAEIVGFVTIRRATDPDVARERVAEMPTLYVHPDHWRSGVGTALCNAGLKRAASLGHSELVLWVLEVNARARAFYRSLGFEADGVRKVDEGTPEGFVADRYRIELPGDS